jgi:hypothetical protein
MPRGGVALSLAALLAVGGCGASDSGAVAPGKAAAKESAAGDPATRSGPDLLRLPAEDICALVPLRALDGRAVAPAAKVVTEEGVDQVHCFFDDAGGTTVASISLGFDNPRALADARDMAQRKKWLVADLPELGDGAFYEVDEILGKPSLARVAGVPRQHADLLIAGLNADLESGELPDREAVVSWYQAVRDAL